MTISKNQKSILKKAAIGAAALVLAVISLVFFVNKEEVISYFSEENTEEAMFEEALGADSRQPAGTESSTLEEQAEDIGLGEEPAADDVRIHGFPYIKLTNRLQKGDYVDVRISFADGGDFVLLSKKKIQGIGPLGEEGTNALWLIVSEEEILRLSSAVVDAYLNQGCSIYAIQYVSESQKEAVVNYAVSDLVKQLMEEDPNIVERAQNVAECSLWEEYEKGILRENSGYTGNSLEKSDGSQAAEAASGEVYPEQEEIIYMD